MRFSHSSEAARFSICAENATRACWLIGAAQAVEHGEQKDTEDRGDHRIQQQIQTEEALGLIEEYAVGDDQNGLVKVKKYKDQAEARQWVLGVDATADGRSKIADNRAGDAVHADGIVVAERILKNADRASEE